MTERTSFYRKIAYLAAIAALLFPLAWLSEPATITERGIDPGGKLAQLRDQYRLGQANLGEIDPASETMKLATLGLRGVAMNLLWEKANHYKKTEDWTNLTATLDQLAKLQPNFITFWKFQSWNISYNVSVEFDDYRDRYHYVRRGIEFLQQGERYNKENPHLLWDLGWFIGQKIGRADEHVQYRRLFKTDDDFHPDDRPPDRRDNWLVGKEWYLHGVDVVDNKGRSIGKKSPKVFFSSPAMSQINYSEAIETEGYFDKARSAWARADREWREFGDRVIEHSTGVELQLNDEPRLEAQIAELQAELDAHLPGVRESLVEDKRAALDPEARKALDTDPAQRTERQMELAQQANYQLEVSHRDVAERIASEKPDLKNEVFKLASELARVEQQYNYTRAYKRDANFDYWQLRCEFEQTPEALRARELLFLGKKAFDQADLISAKQLYQEGFAEWRKVFDTFPALLDQDTTTGDDVLVYVEQYREILDQLDETLGEDFPLWDVIETFDLERKFDAELREHKRRQGIDVPDDPAAQDSAADEIAPSTEQEAPDAEQAQPAEDEPQA